MHPAVAWAFSHVCARARHACVDEGVQPRQVVAAAEDLLARASELRALGTEGTVLVIGSSGFAMGADGALKVQWDALAMD